MKKFDLFQIGYFFLIKYNMLIIMKGFRRQRLDADELAFEELNSNENKADELNVDELNVDELTVEELELCFMLTASHFYLLNF